MIVFMLSLEIFSQDPEPDPSTTSGELSAESISAIFFEHVFS